MKLYKRIACLLSFTLSAMAAQDTDNLTSSVVVTQGCYINSVQNIDFGSIDGNFTANKDASNGSVSVTCTLGTPYSIGLGDGLNSNAGQRRLADATSEAFINYNLYLDSGFSNPWGGIGSGTENTGTGNASGQAYTVFARIPSGQSAVAAGAYNDTVVATVNF